MEQHDTQAPPEGRLISIGEQRIALYERGRGPVPVIFIPGGGAVGLDYWAVHSLVAQDSWSVLYDRAGTGWSTSTPLPRTVYAVTEELNHVINVVLASQTPPILVGHSLGGLYARGYAQRYPVRGLVLLDPDHEDYRSLLQYQTSCPGTSPAVSRSFAAEMIDWPDHIRSPSWSDMSRWNGFAQRSESPAIHSADTSRSVPVACSQTSLPSSSVQPERMGSRT